MLNCREATRLLSERQERTLRFTERVALRFHLAMCVGCRRFGRQMDVMRQAMRTLAARDDGAGPGADGTTSRGP